MRVVTDGGGTAILGDTAADVLDSRAGSNGIVAVCSKKGIRVLNLMSNRLLDSPSYMAKVFSLFAQHRVKVDLVSTSVSNVSVTVHETVPAGNIEVSFVHSYL